MKPRLFLIPLLSILFAAAGATGAVAQNERVALVIGNAAYPDADSPLKDTISHARSMADELKKNGFEVDIAENLSKEAMRTTLDRFYGKIKSGSAALFFFSGFGVQSDRQSYIVPVNAQVWTEADVRRDGFSLDSILAEMNSKGAKVRIAILDASRRNPFERRFRAVGAGLAPPAATRGTAVMFAAAPGSVIRDSERSLFVPALIKEIGRPGKIEEAFNRTQLAVSKDSPEQVPWFSSSLAEEFSLAKLDGSARPRPEPDRPRPDADADARRDYQTAERENTRRAWEDFIRKYPSGRYTDLAREQLAKLDPPRPRPDAEDDARRAYQSAERENTRRAWEDFIRKYPSGRYTDLARDQLAKLDPPRPRPDADDDARRAYETAERENTRRAWEDFIRKYPSGRYTDLARDKLAKLDPPRPRPDADDDARRAYETAERENTRRAWEDFIRKYPSGRYTDQARDKLANLDEADARRAYDTAEREGTRRAWEDFIRKYPSGRYTDQARDKLAKLDDKPTATDARNKDPAIRDLDDRIDRDRNDVAAYYKRGQLFAQHGDFKSAIRDFDEVIRLSPKDAEAFNNRCWARAITGDLQEALKDCNEALVIRPRYLDAFDSRGFVNLKIGLPKNALADYDAALRINPKHPSSLYGRGIAKVRTGNSSSGNTDISAAKAIQSDIADEFASYGIR